LLHTDRLGNTVLHIAVRGRQAAVVKLLLEHGAAAMLNTMQYTSLVGERSAIAVFMMCEDTAILKLLLTAGADVHAVTSSGDTCLHIAARHNLPVPVLCLLIKAGADLRAVNSGGKTAAQLAHNSGNLLIMQVLNRAAQQQYSYGSCSNCSLKLTAETDTQQHHSSSSNSSCSLHCSQALVNRNHRN
jgi:ankyrin repeat protein